MSSSDPISDQLLTDYLLGVASEHNAERIDELSITDEDIAWRLRARENDLIDAYVRGELSGGRLEQFRLAYSSPLRRQKVAFAVGLCTVADRSPATEDAPLGEWQRAQPSTPWKIPGMTTQWTAALAAVLMIATALLVVDDLQLRRQLTISRAAAPQSKVS